MKVFLTGKKPTAIVGISGFQGHRDPTRKRQRWYFPKRWEVNKTSTMGKVGQNSALWQYQKRYQQKIWNSKKHPWLKGFRFAGFLPVPEVLEDLTKALGCSKDELPSHAAALVKKCHEHVAAQHIASWRRCWMGYERWSCEGWDKRNGDSRRVGRVLQKRQILKQYTISTFGFSFVCLQYSMPWFAYVIHYNTLTPNDTERELIGKVDGGFVECLQWDFQTVIWFGVICYAWYNVIWLIWHGMMIWWDQVQFDMMQYEWLNARQYESMWFEAMLYILSVMRYGVM